MLLAFFLIAASLAIIAQQANSESLPNSYDQLPVHNITSLPINITEIGIYRLVNNITYDGNAKILINIDASSSKWSSHYKGPVVIDGNGYTIKYNGSGPLPIFIKINEATVLVKNITLENYGVGIYLVEDNKYHKNYLSSASIFSDIKFVSVNESTVGFYREREHKYKTPIILKNDVFKFKDNNNSNTTAIIIKDTEETLIKNVVIENAEKGIYGKYIDNIAIMNTTASGIIGYGINLYLARYAYLSGIKEYHEPNIPSTEPGIILDSTERLTIVDSLVMGFQKGIYLYDPSDCISIYRNILINNTEVGVKIENEHTVKMFIESNVITGSKLGLDLEVTLFLRTKKYEVINNNFIQTYLGPALNISVSNYYERDVQPFIPIVHGNTFIAKRTKAINLTLVSSDEIGNVDWNGRKVFNFYNNYYSDYSGTGNYTIYLKETNLNDTNPQKNIKPEYVLFNPNTKYDTRTGKLTVSFDLLTLGNTSFDEIGVSVDMTKGFSLRKTDFTWMNLAFTQTNEAAPEQYYNDYNNYTLYGKYEYDPIDEEWYWVQGDDDYFSYRLPFKLNFMGIEYDGVSISTNGYVELTNSNLERNETIFLYFQDYSPSDAHIKSLTYMFPSSLCHFNVTPRTVWDEAVIYGLNGDLGVLEKTIGQGLGIFNMGDLIVVYFNGTSSYDEDQERPVRYQVFLSKNGTIKISIGDIGIERLDGDAFTGIDYVNPYYTEIEGAYVPEPNTSYVMDGSLTHISEKTVAIEPGLNIQHVSVNVTLPHNPDNETRIMIKLHGKGIQATDTDDIAMNLPIIFYRSVPQKTQQPFKLPQPIPVKMTKERRALIKKTIKFFRKHKITTVDELINNTASIKKLAEAMIKENLFSPVPSGMSYEQKMALRTALEAIYGPLLVNYPSPQGRLYLLYWLYLQ